jgi:metal-responsive CopG/Arc/MetJ family transcriptional regulator
MLEAVDAAARAMSATRSELVRAALRNFLRQLAKDEALLTMARTGTPQMAEVELARSALSSRRARRRTSTAAR